MFLWEETEGRFTRKKIFGTARVKTVRVPKKSSTGACLHVLFSAVLSGWN